MVVVVVVVLGGEGEGMSSHVWSLDDLGEGGDAKAAQPGEAAAQASPSVGASITADGVLSIGDLGALICSGLLCSAVRCGDGGLWRFILLPCHCRHDRLTHSPATSPDPWRVAADDAENGDAGGAANEPQSSGSNPMKPGEGIDPANYTGAGDSDYFKQQFQKQQKRNAKKAAAEAKAENNGKIALGIVMLAAAGLFLYSSGQFWHYTPKTTSDDFPPNSLGSQLALEANHGWLLAVALLSTVLLQYAATQAAAARKQ